MQTVIPNASLAEFDRHRQPPPASLSSRVMAAVLTAALGALTVLLGAQRTLWMQPDQTAFSEIVTTLVPELPHKEFKPPPPPFVTLRLRLKAEKPAPPVFTVASETPPAPA